MLKALPDTANRRLVTFLQAAGPVLANKMKSEIPVLAAPRPHRTPGAARNSISWRVTPTTLNLKVGELGKRDIVFYAHILDVGRKAQTVTVTRTARRGGGPPYPMRVPAMKALYIIRSVKASYRLDALPGYRRLMDDILAEASRGAGDD